MLNSIKFIKIGFSVKTIVVMGLFIISTSAFSMVVKRADKANSCTLYRVIEAETKVKKQANEVVVFEKGVYGFSLENLDIDFDHREAKVQVTLNVILGFNKPLLPQKQSIQATNEHFSFLTNQLNRKIMVFEKICIDSRSEIIYAQFYESQKL